MIKLPPAGGGHQYENAGGGYRQEMSESSSETNQENYEDQDAGPTMTAPDGIRPDAKAAADDEGPDGADSS